MQTNSDQLIEEMLLITDRCSKAAQKFRELDHHQLNYKNNPQEWSILECLEHLNLYGDYYLPEIEKQMLAQKNGAPSKPFHSGLLGNYFANLMKGKNGKITRMKSPKDKNPSGPGLSSTTIDRFLKQQELLKALLNRSRTSDLTKTKVPISLTKLIRLRLGDTFRFFVYHIERHIYQAGRVLQSS